MSTRSLPKQLIPFIDGKSLLQIAMERVEGLVPAEQVAVCAGEATRGVMLSKLPGLDEGRFLGEPTGRDTLNAVGLGAAVLGARDPEAVIAVFTADHLITPVDKFQHFVEQGYAIAEAKEDALVTFGIAPTQAATGYGYLQLGERLKVPGGEDGDAYIVDEFKEKPDQATAQRYVAAGPKRYLWNSGMFVWRAETLLRCIERFCPENHEALVELGRVWDTPRRAERLAELYPKLKKISVDYAVMEPASRDPGFTVAAVPMALNWLDVGSWPSFAETREKDEDGNAVAGCHAALLDTTNTLVASEDPDHLIATIGCEDLIVVHTAKATLVCRADQAEQIKQLHAMIGERYGEKWL